MLLHERLKCDSDKLAAVYLNILYVILGFCLLGAVIWHHQQTQICVYPLTLGLAAIGISLSVTAVYGIAVFLWKKPKLIIPYNILSCAIVVLLAGVGGACVTTDSSLLMPYLVKGWRAIHVLKLDQLQVKYNCCGFAEPNLPFNDPLGLGHPPCSKLPCCSSSVSSCCSGWDAHQGEVCPCHVTCSDVLMHHMVHSVQVVGGAALVFALIMLFGTSFLLVHQVQRCKRAKMKEEENEEEEEEENPTQYERF